MLDRSDPRANIAFLPARDPGVPASVDPWDSEFPANRPSADPRFTLEPFSSIEPVVNGSWIIKGLLPTSGLAVLYGEPGRGKSFLALDAALHVASGRSWAAEQVVQGGQSISARKSPAAFENVSSRHDATMTFRTTLHSP